METLASILAGQGANPYQQAGQGISQLLSQFLLNQNLAQGQLGGQAQPQPGEPPSAGAGLLGQQTGQMQGLGSMGAAVNPQLLQAAMMQNQGSY